MKLKLFKLTKLSLSNLGGPMGGDDSTPTLFEKYFVRKSNAYEAALLDASNSGIINMKFDPSPEKKGNVHADCGSVGYLIEAIKTEDNY